MHCTYTCLQGTNEAQTGPLKGVLCCFLGVSFCPEGLTVLSSLLCLVFKRIPWEWRGQYSATLHCLETTGSGTSSEWGSAAPALQPRSHKCVRIRPCLPLNTWSQRPQSASSSTGNSAYKGAIWSLVHGTVEARKFHLGLVFPVAATCSLLEDLQASSQFLKPYPDPSLPVSRETTLENLVPG